MITQKLIPEKIETFQYYVDKLPLYLQKSYGFIEHFKLWHEILVGNAERGGIVGNAEILLNLLNIFDPNYFDYLTEKLEGFETTGSTCDILDKIGSLFGVQRNFNINTDNIVLNNADFLILIKARIIKNYCDGTREIMDQFYQSIGLEMYVNTADSPATANLYLIEQPVSSPYYYSENIKKLYMAGMLTIQSVGITYLTYNPIDLTSLLYWREDAEPTGSVWDTNEWGA